MSPTLKSSIEYFRTIAPDGTRYIEDISQVPVHAYVLYQNTSAGCFTRVFISEVDTDGGIVVGTVGDNQKHFEFGRYQFFEFI